MPLPRDVSSGTLAPNHAALQHGPRPLPLFLDLLRSETAASPDRRAAALAGLRAYQAAPRLPRRSDRSIAAVSGRARLIDFGGSGPPLILVPSLINPPYILDLSDDQSLAGWLAGQGFRTLLLDWGVPSAADAALDVGGHVETLLLPLIDSIGEPPMLVGYCLGGTMALAAAVLRPLRALVLIATPFRFAGFGQRGRSDIRQLWEGARAATQTMGVMPMEVLQSGFWRLDPARTIAKFERFGTLDPESDAARGFVALEDWANDGDPLTFAAGRELLEDFVGADLPGDGRWAVGGRIVDPATLACPALDIISTTDRIVPAASAAGLPDHRLLGAGHVGMIVGSRARAQLWDPLAAWLSQTAAT